MFSKVGVSRLDFKQLLGQALIRRLKKGTVFVLGIQCTCVYVWHPCSRGLDCRYIAAGNEAANLSVMLTGVLAVMSAPTVRSAQWGPTPVNSITSPM